MLNANSSTASVHQEGPFIDRQLDVQDTYALAATPASGATVVDVTYMVVRRDGNTFQRTFTDGTPVPAGQTYTAGRSIIFASDPQCGPPCDVVEVTAAATILDDLGNRMIAAPTEGVSVPPEFLDIVGQGDCESGPNTACFLDNRFAGHIEWWIGPSNRQMATVTSSFDLWTTAGADFVLDGPGPVDVFVLLDDLCNPHGVFTVSFASETNVEFVLTLIDGATGVRREYHQELGKVVPVIVDTEAFATCPGPLPVPGPRN